MLEIFTQSEALPFSIALAVVFGLFLLEIISLLLGGSIMAMGSDAPDIDLDLDTDFDIDMDVDLDAEVATDISIAPSGFVGWLGIKEVPFLIWMVSFLTVFGLSGLVLQSITHSITGALFPGLIASLIMLFPALYGAKFIAAIIARIMPKTESSAMRMRFLGGHHGVISQGTAKRGKPAEAKIKDRHGNTHYLRVEPLEDTAEIPQGTSVHIIRKRDGMFFVVDIS